MDRSKWEYKKLGEVATFLNGYAFKPENWSKHGLKIIRIQNLTDETAPYNRYDGEIDSKYIVRNGDLLISWSATLGAFLWNNDDALLNQHIFKTIFDKSDINKYYLKYCVISKLEEMAKKTHGVTMRHITKKDFDSTIIPCPSLSDQQRIVAELDCLNEMIALKQEQLKEFDKLAQSIFYDMFGDPLKTSKWDKVKLGDVCKTSSGGTPTSSNASYYENGNIGWLRSGDITTHIWKNNAFITEAGMANSSAKLFPINTVVVAMYGATVGQVGILHIETTTNQAVCGIYPNEHFNPIYLCYHFICIKPQLIKSAIGGAQPNISQAVIKKLDIPLPPLALQQQFAEKIQAIEAQKELVKQSIAETQQLLDSRMDYYFD